MDPAAYSIAIETSSRAGGVTLGRGPEVIATIELGEQRRHAVGLLPAIDTLCKQAGIGPADLREIYVSVGPGSFTGLRIGITTAKLLGRTLGSKLIAVPTLDVIVRNAPADLPHVAVLLNAKRGQCFTGIFRREAGEWTPLIEPSLLTPEQMLTRAPRPLAVICDAMPGFSWPNDVQLLDLALARPRSETVWRLGQALAAAGRYVDPVQMTPLYVRLPEAEELWQARQKN
jgi:tRNA threonylcarbamoyladenosine biosynthesis protein TsaB